jgi:hypothetical protein
MPLLMSRSRWGDFSSPDKRAVTGQLELASLFCSDECPEIEHLRFAVICGHSSLINRVAFGKIRNDFRTNELNTFDVFLRNPPGEVGLEFECVGLSVHR